MTLYFDERWAENLDTMLRQIRLSGLDWFQVIDGQVGSGKSTLGLETCAYVDPKFTVKQVGYCLEDILNIIEDLGDPPESVGRAVLWDEAAEGQYALDAMKTDNKETGKLFFRIRKKHLFFVNCVVHFWDLQTSSRLRTMGLAHCEFKFDQQQQILKQGLFGYYSLAKIPQIIKEKNYDCKPDFKATFQSAPTQLWNELQAKNYDYLDEVSANAIIKVRKLNQYSIDKTLANSLTTLLGEDKSKIIASEQATQLLKNKYGEQPWVTNNWIGRKIRGYGFQRYTADPQRRSSVFIITKEGIDNLNNALKNSHKSERK